MFDLFGNFWFRELSVYRLLLRKRVLLNIGIVGWAIEDFKNKSEPQSENFDESIRAK